MLIFGGIALLLSAVGLYGVVAHSVAGRRHEFSIRLAIGAQHSDLLRLVVREAVLLTTVGVFAGALLSIAAVRALASRVYGIIALSPAILIAFALLLFTISLAASYLPARRASHADPLDALRRE